MAGAGRRGSRSPDEPAEVVVVNAPGDGPRAARKSLDRKLAAIHADPSCREFILADAKDADMAFGVGAPGRSPEAHAGELRYRTLAEYRELIRAVARQGLVDILLM